jgi:signal transduction histidine kinase
MWLHLRPDEKITAEQAVYLNEISSEIALALALSIARPQQATRARAEAQFDERRRIAQDLHNALAQQITFLNLSLDRLINSGQQPELEAFHQDLEQMRQVAGDVSEQVRRYLAVIRNWQTANLIQAIAGYARIVTQNTHLPIDFRTDGEPCVLSPQMCQQIFSLIQESLNNIQKHAQAHRAEVTLKWQPDQLRVQVVDTGIGFDPTAIERDGHYGLAIMDEIVDELHGHFTIDSAPGQGTVVTFAIPLPEPPLTAMFETPIASATLAVASAP